MPADALAQLSPAPAGEAVFFLPNNSAWGKPAPFIPATVTDPRDILIKAYAKARIQRDDKPRPMRVHCSSLAYRGFCGDCLVPAVVEQGELLCPQCGRAAIAEPPPDALVLRWFPLRGHAPPRPSLRAVRRWT